uniref:Type VI secretion system tube protein Hcp n=2 Tax=unclassified bacterial viruses TaxID=12333 RepID=A0AAU7J8J9_9VIRU
MAQWRGVLAVEGRETADGRLIEPSAIEWTGDPIPLMRSLRGTSEGDWSMPPLIGYTESIERRETADGVFLIYAEGTLLDTEHLPDVLDLSMVATSIEADMAMRGDGPRRTMTLSRCQLRQIVVGSEKVWDECVLEVVEGTNPD